jgi:uncharacterized surface anchored protein
VARDGGMGFTDVTTGAGGRAYLQDIAPGTYSVTELSVPGPYVLDSTPRTVILEPGKTATIVLKNSKKPGIIIRKYDEDTALPLAGAEFSIAKKGGSVVFEGVTGASGMIHVENLEAGQWYTITELAAPKGYLKAQESKDVYLEPGKTVEVKFDNRLRPALRIVKLDAKTGSPLPGAVFRVRKAEGGTESEYVTGANGTFTVNDLDEAIYTVTEVTPPPGYLPDTNAHRDILLEWGKTKELVFTDEPKPGLLIRKIDADTNAPLAGATFRIAAEDGFITRDVQTDNSGSVHIQDLIPGVFTVTELTPPADYLPDAPPQTIRLVPGEQTTAVFANRKKPSLIIRKYDELTGLPLAGAEFSIAEKGGAITAERMITEANGEIRLDGLDTGWITVTELAAPAGYLITTPSKDILLQGGKTAELKFDNRPRPVLEILKTDEETGAPLAGAKIRVTKTEDKTVSEYITGADGKVVIRDLDEAVYSVEEIIAPAGYLLEPQHKDIELEWGKTKTLKFDNIRKPVAMFLKTNALTGKPIAGATFKVEYEQPGGGLRNLGSLKTGEDGRIIIPKAEVGWYVFTETMPAQGFSLPKNPVTRIYFAAGDNAYLPEFEHYYASGSGIADAAQSAATTLPGDLAEADFALAAARSGAVEHSGSEYYTQGEGFNWPLNSIVIKKTHAITGELLAGAAFGLYRADEQVSGVPGTMVGRYTTDNSGVIVITGLEPGYYVAVEEQAPPNFLISENGLQNGFLKPDGTTVPEFSFADYPYGALLISKVDALTGTPLAGAKFKVTDGAGAAIGNTNGEYVTDSRGEILIENVKPCAAVVTEIQAPANYAINRAPKTVQIGTDGKTYKVSFDNYPYGTLVIRKYDSLTKAPLAGAEIKVTASDGSVVGTSNGIFTTDETGTVTIPNLPKNGYIIGEVKAPDGYILENQTQAVSVEYGKTHTVDIYNKKMSGARIVKIDATSKQPLKDAHFTVYKQSGEVVGNYVTDGNGLIILDRLEPGWYKAVETKAPEGWLLDDTPQDFQVTANQFIKLTFENKQLSSLQIRKVSETDGTPLAGAVFEVRKQNGEYVGEFTTGADGAVSIPNAAPGWYVISEKKAPEGFILDETARTVEVKPVTPTVVTFANKPLSGLKIIKTSGATGQPIEGVEFEIAKMSGDKVTNELNGYTFTTDKTGQIYVPNLTDGYYVVTETRQKEGYVLDGEPKTVLVQSGRPTVLEVLNTPQSGLLIVKTDEKTGKPLAGVVFDVTKADGQRVSGYISDGNQPNTEANSPNRTVAANGDISGSYTTDAQGRILINALSAGEYRVTESKALDGYEIDAEVHSVTVTPGKLATLQLTNRQKAGIRLLKTDSVTKLPICNVEFMLFDAAGKAVGTYYTDNNGLIDFTGLLSEGRYTLRETRPAANYYADDVPRTIEFRAGQTTEIKWENTPRLAQIQILKKSGDDNEINGLPAGTPLVGAVFEAYDYKTGNTVDRFVSGSDGRAVSKPLPLGRYLVKEVQSPQWYKLSDKNLDVDLEFATQIVKLEYLNYSANTGVYIKKTGPAECMPGNTISYAIKAVQNTGAVPLSDFYWRDTLPTDAVRLTRIVTGTYNQALKYKVMITTNKGDQRIIADNLSTTKNNVIDCANASLGLRSDEYVTSFTLLFGTVKAGFAQVEQPQIFAKVLQSLPNGYEFANKSDIAGKHGREWIAGNSVWRSTVYSKSEPLPRTGY